MTEHLHGKNVANAETTAEKFNKCYKNAFRVSYQICHRTEHHSNPLPKQKFLMKNRIPAFSISEFIRLYSAFRIIDSNINL
jgi:hypothetical protein